MPASGGSLRALCIVQLGGGATPCRRARLQLEHGLVEVVRIDQWGARHTRANHNAHCCRRAIRPHPRTASFTVNRRLLRRSFHPGRNLRVGSNRGDSDRKPLCHFMLLRNNVNTAGIKSRRKICIYSYNFVINYFICE